MSQTKELNTNEKLVTTLTVLAGVIIFALTLMKCQKGADFLGLEEKSVDPVTENYTKELSQDISNLEAQMRANLEASDREIANLHVKYGSEIKELNAKLKSFQDDLIFKTPVTTKAAGVAGVETVPLTDFEEIKAQLIKKNNDYDTLKASLTDKDGGDVAELTQQKKELSSKLDKLTLEKEEILKKAAKAEQDLNNKIKVLKAGEETQNSEALLKDAVAKADSQWKKQISQLKVQHGQDIAKLRNDHKKEFNQFRTIVRSSRAKKVFADTTADLAPAAKTLIESLDEYEGTKPAELNKLYEKVDKNQGAVRRLIVNFASGSSVVTAEDQEKIKGLIEKAGDNSYFVAVGYADPTGTASKNKALSSKRATGVAKVIKPSLSETQFTQAYYLGQTSRFGADENNRIVEIWEITE